MCCFYIALIIYNTFVVKPLFNFQCLRTLNETEQKLAELDEQNARHRLQEIDAMLAALYTSENYEASFE